MFRKILVFLASSSLGFLLMTTVALTAMAVTFTPSNLKQWLRSSNVYSTFVDDLIRQSDEAISQKTASEEPSHFADPNVQAIVKKTFPPEFLQIITEQFIDGTTPWLENKIPEPSFVIDLSQAKTNLIENVTNYARNRYATLPTCAPSQINGIDRSDILNVPCQIPGYSIETDIQRTKDELSRGEEFLPKTVITADTLSSGQGANKQPLFSKLDSIPEVYGWVRRSPLIFGLLSLTAASIIIFLSAVRRSGIRRVSTTLAIIGVLLFGVTFLTSAGVEALSKKLSAQSSNPSDFLKDTGMAVLHEIERDINQSITIFAIVFAAAAIILFGYLFFTRHSAKALKPETQEAQKPSNPSEKQSEKPETKKSAGPEEPSQKPEPKDKS